MKNKWLRLIAAVLALAMAFSICAMPASASVWDENEWYIGKDCDEFWMWASEAYFREATIKDWDEDEDGEMTDEAMAEVMADIKIEASYDSKGVFVEGTIPSNAYFGYSRGKNSRIYWYTKADDSNMSNCQKWSVNWSTGTLTYYTADGAKKQIEAIKATNNTSSGGSGNASSGSDGAVLLLAGGAVVAVAAGVAVYLYTQPAVVQKIKNFFMGNSAAEQSAQTAAAESEAAAVNEADVNEAAAENAVELPAEAEQAA